MKYVIVEKTKDGLRKVDMDCEASDVRNILVQATAALEGLDIDVITAEAWDAIPFWIKAAS